MKKSKPAAWQVDLWCDVIPCEAVDGWETSRPGRKHASIRVPVPVWLAMCLLRTREAVRRRVTT